MSPSLAAQCRDVPLFQHIDEAELTTLLSCLNARQQTVEKGDFILHQGQAPSQVGVVLEGQVHILKEDVFGNRTILASLSPPQVFAEVFSCAQVDRLPVSVQAATPCKLLMIDYRRIIHQCPAACNFHGRLIENMMRILAQKNLMLNRQIGHLSRRSTREKVLSYLAEQAQQQGTRHFTIPFSRQELADYLCVERSALSATLGNLQREGMIAFHRNAFELLREYSTH